MNVSLKPETPRPAEPSSEDRRALYTEAGLMLRMCDTLTAGFIQYYGAIAAAVAAARAMNQLSPEAFAWILGAASVVFLTLSLRIRRNYAQFLEVSLSLEREMANGRSDLRPHGHNQDRHRRLSWSPVPMLWLYSFFYLAGLVIALCVGLWGY